MIGEQADLTDGDDVLELAMRVHARVGDVDGVVHLVGGWRGGGGIPGQTEEDYRVLERSFTALRYVSRAFWDDLVASAAGRIAIVSSTTVERPGRGQRQLHRGEGGERVVDALPRPGLRRSRMPPAAAVTFRVRSLAGLEDTLAASVVGLWRADAAELNGRVEELTPHA